MFEWWEEDVSEGFSLLDGAECWCVGVFAERGYCCRPEIDQAGSPERGRANCVGRCSCVGCCGCVVAFDLPEER